MQQHFWKESLVKVLETLGTSDRGLTSEEATARLIHYGKNIPHVTKRRSHLKIFFEQCNSPLIIILIGVSIFSFFVDQSLEGSIIMGMLLINTVIGFIQETKAEKSLERLQTLVSFHAKAFRDGKLVQIKEEELVPGDIIIVNAGDLVPADARLIESKNLVVMEAALTGESVHIAKNATFEGSPATVPQNIINGVFMGTSVVVGYGKAVVVQTGKQTCLGQSVAGSEMTYQQTNFEKNLMEFSQLLLQFVVILTIVITLVNTYLGRGLVNSLLLAITLALGITPEVLPIIVTVAISSAAFILAKKKVIIRRLTAIEDLGNIDVLCSDKTGTITTGILTMTKYATINDLRDGRLLSYGFLCNAYNPIINHMMSENPLDEALYRETGKVNKGMAQGYKLLDWHDFDFDTKMMTVLVEEKDGKRILIQKGATESILERSHEVYVNNGKVKLTKEYKKEIREKIAAYEDKGYRVISLGYIETNDDKINDQKEPALIYFGYFVFEDPPRRLMKAECKQLQSLHIQLKIITGDSPIITKEICEKVGVEVVDNRVVLGEEFEYLSEEECQNLALKYNVFARVSPIQKQRIIQMIQKFGHVVAYMGDGINDVGALTAADVGISVEGAVAVTKDVSDVILLKKDIAALIMGVIEGRKTFGNTVKFIINTMSSSFGNVITIAISSMFLKFIPMLPSQVLLLDGLSDIQHLTISTDNVDKELTTKPRNWDRKFLVRFMIFFGLISTIFDFILIGILLVLKQSPDSFRTVWFIESSITELLITFSIRTMHPFFKSRATIPVMATSLIAILITIILPFTLVGKELFGFIVPQLQDFIVIGIVVAVYFFLVELGKYIFYRKIYNPYG